MAIVGDSIRVATAGHYFRSGAHVTSAFEHVDGAGGAVGGGACASLRCHSYVYGRHKRRPAFNSSAENFQLRSRVHRAFACGKIGLFARMNGT